MISTRTKSTLKAFAAAGASAVLLAACANNQVDSLAQSPLSGNTYQDKVAANYAEFAKFEYDEMYDTIDSAYFAEKGKKALSGTAVTPEEPEKWNIENKQVMSDLQGGRAQLMSALNNGSAVDFPGPTARALVSYDCWVEQAEEGWQYDHIAGCRDSFNRAMAVIDKGMQPKPVAAVQPAPVPPSEYLVFFDWDSSVLKPQAQQIIATAAENARAAGIDQWDIVGHADRSGPSDYNRGLSMRRANAVAAELSRHGFGRDNVDITARGESDPLVKTGDGIREPQNRRVRLSVVGKGMGT